MILFLLQSPVRPHQWITQSKQCSSCWVGGSRKMDQRHHLSATTWWRLVWSLMYQNYIMVQCRLPTLRAGETSWLDRWTQPLHQNLWQSLRPSDWGEGCNLRQASSMGVWPAVVWQWWHYMLTALNPPWYPKVLSTLCHGSETCWSMECPGLFHPNPWQHGFCLRMPHMNLKQRCRSLALVEFWLTSLDVDAVSFLKGCHRNFYRRSMSPNERQ